MDIAENVYAVLEKIRRAAEASGRQAEEICLVAASKMNDAEHVQQAIKAGIRVCGENRVQEMLEKNSLGAYEGAGLHFIGHLQKNKVKNVVGLAELIHSVHSTELMSAINRIAGNKGLIQDILLEVNIGNEPSKSGFAAEEIPAALETAAAFSSLRVRGLMAIPPVCRSGEENRPYFDRMKQLFVDNSVKRYDNVSMDFLSMGMSGDYETAIACGANMVRVGSAIFGPRDYSRK